MRTPDQIRSDIRTLQDKVAALYLELKAAELAECNVPFKIGQRVKWRGAEYEIGQIEPWGRDNAALKGHKLKKNGAPSERLTYIASAHSLMSET